MKKLTESRKDRYSLENKKLKNLKNVFGGRASTVMCNFVIDDGITQTQDVDNYDSNGNWTGRTWETICTY